MDGQADSHVWPEEEDRVGVEMPVCVQDDDGEQGDTAVLLASAQQEARHPPQQGHLDLLPLSEPGQCRQGHCQGCQESCVEAE